MEGWRDGKTKLNHGLHGLHGWEKVLQKVRKGQSRPGLSLFPLFASVKNPSVSLHPCNPFDPV